MKSLISTFLDKSSKIAHHTNFDNQSMTIQQYIDNLNQRYKLGNATEHTFRGDLQTLIESLVPDIRATNEPKRQSCGAPDYILTRGEIPIGFIEAKDIGDKDLAGAKKTGNKEQFDRYKASLNNLFFTDYLDFHLYIDGQFITKIAIAEITDKGITALPQNFAIFENLIKDFCSHIGQTIKSSKKLAEMMAGKARLLSDIIEKALITDEANQEKGISSDSTLQDQMFAFRNILIHDITPKGFADVYAQTISYGMFAARLHDPTLPTFSRQEAAELIPKSNPFLRKLFGYIAGPDIDDRIKWVVDSLVEIFLACNVKDILKNYGKTTKMEDPIIHFYENFLSEYDPKLRKARGVWYTPAPVVNFIVRAVDDILKTEFDLPQGLADTSKTKIKVNLQATDKRYINNIRTIEEEVHRVQILDPATGTGTFLAEVVKHIHQKFEGQQGIWSKYVETHLLPRLNGFELLMASYAMAHLQLDLLLTETGYKTPPSGAGGLQRLRVYLTNSLEESHPDTGTLFANWLSSEANEANHIKRDAPVMCIIGNPPYSGESANKGDWIMKLMEDYKKEPGGKEKLKERNPKWINDDYVKFLRYGQHFIEKNGSGVLAFINPHGFLDNPTFRGMRWNLLKTYDKIYTIDLHGNAKKKETSPDGSADVNVFDIEQGVSINFFIKTGKKKANELGQVFHYDLFGKRELKYDFLNENSLNSVAYVELENNAPNYGFYCIKKLFNCIKKDL
ncbi:MAG: DNA methyltransferase [Emticicia sp.]|nr:DNA methyltransferase [Emticicia sp.]